MPVGQKVLIWWVLALGGCMKPNPLLYTLGGDSTDSESGDGDSGDGETGDGDSAAAMPTDVLEEAKCEPLDPFEPGCGECLALACCDLALACTLAEQCPCLAECKLRGGNNNTCRDECGGVKPKDVAELEPLLECASSSCAQECAA